MFLLNPRSELYVTPYLPYLWWSTFLLNFQKLKYQDFKVGQNYGSFIVKKVLMDICIKNLCSNKIWNQISIVSDVGHCKLLKSLIIY